MWENNPFCHWCGEPTELTNCPNGQIPNKAATIDHLYSKLDPRRWVKRKPGEVKKVLACYDCNQRRSIEETSRLTKEEITMRSQGFSLNPNGKPNIIQPFDTLEEVVQHLANVIDIKKYEVKEDTSEIPPEKHIDISAVCDKVTI